MTAEWTPAQRRVRTIATLACLLAPAAAVFGMWPGGVDLYSWKDRHIGSAHAGGWSLVIWALLQLWVATFVRSHPSRRHGGTLFIASLGFAVVCAIAWIIEQLFTTGLASAVERWPAHLTAVAVGSCMLLELIVLPIVLVFSREPAPLPESHVVRGA